ncbi:tyrosine-type recombinase/integrase [Nocardioides sp. Soil796]|uniref:tyrosine-type recombinase/integrase n=1 Tax=Nocardioides sp. Soil796 TaxID=1736412 RepID=UPI00070F5D45|nr:site-specific integrase [Nocardioides sp. Soil796]KRF10921.1 hypothetical protein ASH02_18950 [Nocardioides sp. Soil796]
MASIAKFSKTRADKRTGKTITTERWRARYRDANGREHARHFVKKADARRWLDEVTASVVTGRYVDPRAGRETFKEYAERWRQRQVHTENTGESFESILRLHVYPTIGGTRLARISQADVQSLVRHWVDTKAAPTTVEGRYTVLSIVLKAAVKERALPESPCVDIKLPALPPRSTLVPISTETVVALREALPGRYKALVTVAAGTGMRRGELLGLTTDRIALDFGVIRVDRQAARRSTSEQVAFADTKTPASVRNIAVAQVVLDAIEEHIASYGVHDTGLLFTSTLGSALRPSTLQRAWSLAARQVGTDATMHDLRHYFASVQIAGGTSIKALQALLGHKSATETWDTYGHLMGDEDDRSRAVIQSALGGLADSLRTVAPS